MCLLQLMLHFPFFCLLRVDHTYFSLCSLRSEEEPSFLYLSGFAHSARPGWRIRACGWIVRGVIGLFFKNHWMQGHNAPMKPREVPTRPPDGSQVAHMRPQDVPWSPPGGIREACAFLAPRGGSSKARPKSRMVFFYIGFIVFLSCRQNVGL